MLIDGVLTVCSECGNEVPLRDVDRVEMQDGVAHVLWECLLCGFGECFHMSLTDWAAAADSLVADAGGEPIGLLSEDEQTLLAFRAELDAVSGVADLEAKWLVP